MGLRRRLRKAERNAETSTVVLVVQDTGEEVRVPEDAGLRYVVADWLRTTGQKVPDDPLVGRLEDLMPRGLREKNPARDGRIFCVMDEGRRRQEANGGD
jgi:hypothetical protein